MVLYEENNQWDSRKIYIMVLISQSIGISNINSIPNNALIQGATGYTMFLIVAIIFIGIPILYMESIVAQFTTRDCIDVWKIRPCFSYIGYMLVVWQGCTLIYNHTVTSFFLHYLLISFENPIPFYSCGLWSSEHCGSLSTNYTVNQHCIKYQNLFPYCENLYETFPEYQYWRRNLIKTNDNGNYHIAWRVCLASGIICVVMYLSCFKRFKSLKWIVSVFVIYPFLALVVLLMGSMLQKGLVIKYEDSLDLDFSEFKKKFRLSNVVQQVVHNLNIGSGIMFTLTSSSSFRSPCFSDIVMSVVICTIFTFLFIFTVAMMTCPYAYEYGIQPLAIMKIPMSFSFEKIPRLLYQYKDKTFYLVILYSCNTVLGINTSIIYLFNLHEVVIRRCPKLAKYPGLMTFCAVIFLFLITIPLLSYHGVTIIAFSFRRYFTLVTTFVGILECLVFIILYGIHKFSEDVHFMLGIKQKNCIKIAWILSFIILIYTFTNELYYYVSSPTGSTLAIYGVLFVVALFLLLFIMVLVVAICRKRLHKIFLLDATWGPKSEILQRSRAMFSAQAMTKEYIYRQYHLQAGIVARQTKSNKIKCTLQNNQINNNT